MNVRIVTAIFLLAVSAGFFILTYVIISGEHNEVVDFLPHLTAVFLELALAVFFVEVLMRNREKQEETHRRRDQLKLIKSAMFRKEMQDLFVANFMALKDPVIKLSDIKGATIGKLLEWRAELEQRKSEGKPLQYEPPEAMEKVILEYVKAGPVWEQFKNFGITYSFTDVFDDMIYIQHFIADVEVWRKANPGACFMRSKEAASTSQMKRVNNVLGDGILKFIAYAIELKESDLKVKGEGLFDRLMEEYERASKAYALANSGR